MPNWNVLFSSVSLHRYKKIRHILYDSVFCYMMGWEMMLSLVLPWHILTDKATSVVVTFECCRIRGSVVYVRKRRRCVWIDLPSPVHTSQSLPMTVTWHWSVKRMRNVPIPLVHQFPNLRGLRLMDDSFWAFISSGDNATGDLRPDSSQPTSSSLKRI